jgi:hypothetical protein
MNRRDLLQWITGLLAGTLAGTEPKTISSPKTLPMPKNAGFNGSFMLYRNKWTSGYNVKLARCLAVNPDRFKILPNQMVVWQSEDKSIEKLVYRNNEGKLFSLEFAPMEETMI